MRKFQRENKLLLYSQDDSTKVKKSLVQSFFCNFYTQNSYYVLTVYYDIKT